MIKNKRPYADPTAKRRNVYMNTETMEKLKRLGDGNVSAGIRKAVEVAWQGMEVK